MSKKLAGLFLLISMIPLGCTPVTLYDWGDYDASLHSYYKDPTLAEQFRESLAVVIQDSENIKKVPPGLYAEYGFLLYESGDFKQAIVYFEKEKNMWPESQFFMDKMIRNAGMMGKQKTNGSLEGGNIN